MKKNKISSYILLQAMILIYLQPAFALKKTTDDRAQTVSRRPQTYYRHASPSIQIHSLSTINHQLSSNSLIINNLPSDFAKAATNKLTIKKNPFRFSGYYKDLEAGNYYLNARYYSPVLRRFISRDTYDLANRYAYCDGNPFDNVDPSGHKIEPLISYGLGLALAVSGLYPILKNNALESAIGFGLSGTITGFAGNIGDMIAFQSPSKTTQYAACTCAVTVLSIALTGIGTAITKTANKLAGYSAENLEKLLNTYESMIDNLQTDKERLTQITDLQNTTLNATTRDELKITETSFQKQYDAGTYQKTKTNSFTRFFNSIFYNAEDFERSKRIEVMTKELNTLTPKIKNRIRDLNAISLRIGKYINDQNRSLGTSIIDRISPELHERAIKAQEKWQKINSIIESFRGVRNCVEIN